MDQIFLVVALGFLLVMMFMSSRKRKKQAEQLQSTISKGATVMLTSGIVGTITAIEGDQLVIDSEGSKLRVVKLAVRSVEKSAAASAIKSVPNSAAKPAAKQPAGRKPAVKKPASTSTKSASAKKPAAKKTSAK